MSQSQTILRYLVLSLRLALEMHLSIKNLLTFRLGARFSNLQELLNHSVHALSQAKKASLVKVREKDPWESKSSPKLIAEKLWFSNKERTNCLLKGGKDSLKILANFTQKDSETASNCTHTQKSHIQPFNWKIHQKWRVWAIWPQTHSSSYLFQYWYKIEINWKSVKNLGLIIKSKFSNITNSSVNF